MLSGALVCATVQLTSVHCAVKCQEIAGGHWNCIEIAKVPFASLAVRVQVEQFTMLEFEMIFELLPLLPPLTCPVCIFSDDMLTINSLWESVKKDNQTVIGKNLSACKEAPSLKIENA